MIIPIRNILLQITIRRTMIVTECILQTRMLLE